MFDLVFVTSRLHVWFRSFFSVVGLVFMFRVYLRLIVISYWITTTTSQVFGWIIMHAKICLNIGSNYTTRNVKRWHDIWTERSNRYLHIQYDDDDENSRAELFVCLRFSYMIKKSLLKSVCTYATNFSRNIKFVATGLQETSAPHILCGASGNHMEFKLYGLRIVIHLFIACLIHVTSGTYTFLRLKFLFRPTFFYNQSKYVFIFTDQCFKWFIIIVKEEFICYQSINRLRTQLYLCICAVVRIRTSAQCSCIAERNEKLFLVQRNIPCLIWKKYTRKTPHLLFTQDKHKMLSGVIQ